MAQVCPHCGLRAEVVPPDQPIMPEGVVGKPRRAALTFLANILPLVDFILWPLMLLGIFRPLDKQHGRFHPMAAWVTALIPLAAAGVFLVLAALGMVAWLFAPLAAGLVMLFAIPYSWTGLRRLQRSRRARGITSGIGVFWFHLLAVLPSLAALGGAFYLVGTGGKLDGTFTAGLLNPYSDTHGYDALLELDWWVYVALGALYAIPTALALAMAQGSANKLWQAIYLEKGEAWPWRTSHVSEPEIPMTP